MRGQVRRDRPAPASSGGVVADGARDVLAGAGGATAERSPKALLRSLAAARSPPPPSRGLVHDAAEPGPAVAGQRRRQRPAVGRVGLVGLGEAGALHLLRGLGDPHLLVAVDLRERVVELVDRVVRVLDLRRGAPALRRPLLEQPERVAVAVVEVAQLALLEGRGQRDRGGPRRQPAPYGDGGDRRGVLGLLGRQVDPSPPTRGRAALRVGQRPDAASSSATPTPPTTARPTRTSRTRLAARTSSVSCACRSALSAMPSPPTAPPRPHRSWSCGGTARCCAGELGGLDHPACRRCP